MDYGRIESIVIVHPARQHQNGSLPLHHAVKDKQQSIVSGGSTVLFTLLRPNRNEIANRMGRSWVPGATRARTAPYIIDWRLEGPPEPPRQHCLRTILYAVLKALPFFRCFPKTHYDFFFYLETFARERTICH